MSHFIEYAVHGVVGLLAIMNPLGNAPIFGTMVDRLPLRKQQVAAVRTSLIIFGILVIAAIVGRPLLQAFGVSLSAFRVAGGLVIGAMGWRMLMGSASVEAERHADNEEIRERLLVPFAMPMVAGPGTITAVISLGVREPGVVPTSTLVAVAIACAATLATLLVFVRIESYIPRETLRIVTRFMGLVLVAIGVQFVLAGWTEFSAADPGLHAASPPPAAVSE